MLEGMPITWVDIAVISVVSISGVLAYLRGFTKETLSITAWVGAVLLTYYGFDFLVPYADQFFGKGWIATLATIAGPFVFCLILLGVIAGYLAKKIKNSAAGPVDRAGQTRQQPSCHPWIINHWHLLGFHFTGIKSAHGSLTAPN